MYMLYELCIGTVRVWVRGDVWASEWIFLASLMILQLIVLVLLLQVLLLWLSSKRATLQELLEAVEHTSAGAGTLQRLIEMAR